MKHRWFVRGDIDGFFGLFIDNLLQLMVIAVLGLVVGGLPPELITGRILPDAAVSILIGTIIAALCIVGGVTLILQYIPIEATLGILLWIGIIITAQAFQEVPKRHTLAVAFGLVPSLAAWALTLIETSLQKAGRTLFEVAPACR